MKFRLKILLTFFIVLCAFGVHGVDINPVPREYDRDMFWIIPVLVLSLLSVIIIRVMQYHKLEQIVLSAVRLKPFAFQQEDVTFTSVTSLLLTSGSVVMNGLLFFNVGRLFSSESIFSGIGGYAILCGIYLVWMLYRLVSLWLTQFITEANVGLPEVRYNYILLNQLGAIVLLPVLIIASLSNVDWVVEIAVWIGIFIFGIIELIRLYRSLVICFSKGLSPLYFILYICSLEILPLIVLIKLFVG